MSEPPITDKKRLRILLGYPYFSATAYGDAEQSMLAFAARMRAIGFDVDTFCLTLNAPGPCLTFPALDDRWRRGDRELLGMYERLEQRLESCDVLINWSGINLHPRFVEQLEVFTVFQCFDDPESSEALSRPVASAYDLCLVGNVAEVESYHSWGAKAAEWIPMGLSSEIYDPTLTAEQILTGTRDIDLLMMVDRTYPLRTARLDRLAEAFPGGMFFGKGWPRGFLSNDDQLQLLRRTKIGPNIHNSTGPINYRTFYLPANGVMQICDNKSHLGQIFELGREVVGFDSIVECIDLCRYYIAHDRERREIAGAGWKRVTTDYTEEAVFRRRVALIQRYRGKPSTARCGAASSIAHRHFESTRAVRRKSEALAAVRQPLAGSVQSLKNTVKRIIGRP